MLGYLFQALVTNLSHMFLNIQNRTQLLPIEKIFGQSGEHRELDTKHGQDYTGMYGEKLFSPSQKYWISIFYCIIKEDWLFMGIETEELGDNSVLFHFKDTPLESWRWNDESIKCLKISFFLSSLIVNQISLAFWTVGQRKTSKLKASPWVL